MGLYGLIMKGKFSITCDPESYPGHVMIESEGRNSVDGYDLQHYILPIEDKYKVLRVVLELLDGMFEGIEEQERANALARALDNGQIGEELCLKECNTSCQHYRQGTCPYTTVKTTCGYLKVLKTE